MRSGLWIARMTPPRWRDSRPPGRTNEGSMKPLWNALLVATAFAGSPGFAQDAFPDKPIRFVVPFPPGGGTDAFARVVGAKLTEIWGQQVVVDNRAGAQGNIGTALGAKAPPDGYTITLAH